MLNVSKEALAHLKNLIEQRENPSNQYIRLYVAGFG